MLTSQSLFSSGLLQAAPGEPKPPLSAYNLYFQLERKRILDGTDQANLPVTVEELRVVSLAHKNAPKRIHRKTHGKIGFRDLARTIANRWKKLDKSTRQLLEEQAVEEKKEYAIRHKAWKSATEAQAAAEHRKHASLAVNQCEAPSFKPGVAEGLEACIRDGASRMQVLHELRMQIEDEMRRLSNMQKTRVVSPATTPEFGPVSSASCMHQIPSQPMVSFQQTSQSYSYAPPVQEVQSYANFKNRRSSLMPLDWSTDGPANEDPFSGLELYTAPSPQEFSHFFEV